MHLRRTCHVMIRRRRVSMRKSNENGVMARIAFKSLLGLGEVVGSSSSSCFFDRPRASRVRLHHVSLEKISKPKTRACARQTAHDYLSGTWTSAGRGSSKRSAAVFAASESRRQLCLVRDRIGLSSRKASSFVSSGEFHLGLARLAGVGASIG